MLESAIWRLPQRMEKARNWSPPAQVDTGKTTTGSFAFASQMKPAEAEAEEASPETTLIHVEHGTLSTADFALGRRHPKRGG